MSDPSDAQRVLMRSLALLVVVAFTASCGGSAGVEDAGGTARDAGAIDASPIDAASLDAGSLDARASDAAYVDGPRVRIDGGPISDEVPAYIRDAVPGQWTEIGSNTLADVAFDYAATPPPDGFRTSLEGLMDAWSGATYSRETHRLYVNGGGHRDYDGNEWYAFDVHAGRWERLNDPSLHLESEATGGVFPDGAPIPIHTYDCLVYAPTTHSLFRMGTGGSPLGRIWEFDLATLTWSATAAEVTDPHSGTARWDPATEQIFLLQNAAHAAGYANVYRFDPATGTKTLIVLYGPTMGTVTGTLDTTASELVYTGAGIAPTRVSTATGAATTTTTSGDTRLEAINGPGLVYDARRDRFTGWGAGDTRTLFHLSKTDWSWTTETPSSGATPGAINPNGVFGRFQYLPEYDVLLLATTVRGAVMMFKPADWAPPS